MRNLVRSTINIAASLARCIPTAVGMLVIAYVITDEQVLGWRTSVVMGLCWVAYVVLWVIEIATDTPRKKGKP